MAPAALTRQEWEKEVVFMQKLAMCVGPAGLQLDGAAVVLATHMTLVTRIETASRVPMPPTTWRKLLAKKVPLQLATTCCKLLTDLLVATDTGAASNASGTADGAATLGASSSRSSSDTSTPSARRHPGSGSRPTAPLHNSNSSSSVSGIHQIVLAGLEYLVRRACRDLCSGSHQALISADAAAFRQQMQQSGFLQLLPQLLISLTKRLQASTGLVPQLQPRGGQQGNGRPVLARSTSVSSSSSHAAASAAAGLDVFLAYTISSALTTYGNLSTAWPHAVFVTEVAPDCTAAVLQLSWLSFQTISMVLAHDSSSTELPDALMLSALAELWRTVGDAVSTAVLPITAPLAPPGQVIAASPQSIAQHRSCLLASPCALPCLVFYLAVMVYATLLAQLPGLPRLSRANRKSPAAQCTAPTVSQDGASTDAAAGSPAQQPGASSTINSNSSKAKPAARDRYTMEFSTSTARLSSAPTAAWQLACQECADIPVTHEMLLQHLGCSSMSALFCAAYWMAPQQLTSAHGRLDVENVARLLENVEGAQAAYCMLLGVLTDDATCAEYAQQPCSAAQRHLHLLLAPLMMYWAAHQPAQLAGSPVDCRNTIQTAGSALEMALQDLPAAQPLYFQQQNCASTIQDQHLCQLVLDEVLPLVVVVGSSALDSMSSNSQAGPAEPASSSSSSSTTAAGSSNAKKTSQCATAWSSQPSKTALNIFNVVCMLVSFAADTSEVAAIKLQERAVLLGKLMEAAVRGWQDIHFGRVIDGHKEEHGECFLAKIIAMDSFLLKAACCQGTQACSSSSTDSPEQLQLLSLCCSVLKALTAMAQAQPEVTGSPAVLESCLCVAEAAGGMLEWLAAGDDSQQQPAAAAAAAPWLTLSGRVLLFAAHWQVNAQCKSLLTDTLSTVVRPIKAWLRVEGNADRLSAAGYDPSGSLVQQLQPAVCAYNQTSSSAAAAAAAGGGTQQQDASASNAVGRWQSIGLALSTLPCPYFCCHSACSNLAGPSELQLVNGKSCLCGGCLVARYCCRGCQRAAWKQHKPVCGAIAAASKQAADAGGGGGGGVAAS